MNEENPDINEWLKKYNECTEQLKESYEIILEGIKQMDEEILSKLKISSLDDTDEFVEAFQNLSNDDKIFVYQYISWRDNFCKMVLRNEMEHRNKRRSSIDGISEILLQIISDKTKDGSEITEDDRIHIEKLCDSIKKAQEMDINFHPKKREIEEFLQDKDFNT